MTNADEPTRPDHAVELEDEEVPTPPQDWLGAFGQMAAALLAVIALVGLGIGAAVVVRRLLP